MSENPDSSQTLDEAALEARANQGITNWIASNLGGEVLKIERQERWRPQWKVTFKKGDTTDSVFVRGDRPGAAAAPLRFEMECMQVLEANGVKVPHIFGWMDDPTAFVMDWIECDEDRAPGMMHTAILNPPGIDDDRWQATLSYMDHMAKMHAIPVSEFEHVAGLKDTQDPKAIALHFTDQFYEANRKMGNIDPTLAFIQSWLRRNVPQHRTKACFISGDSGQFMSQGSEVVALMDFEIAAIGDSHWDLACMRCRHPYENMGDIPALYRRYGEASGQPVDLPVICYHSVNFMQFAALANIGFLNQPVRGTNWLEAIIETANLTRRSFEAISELKGYTLDFDLELPEPVIKPYEDPALGKIIGDVERLPISTAFQEYERYLLAAIPKFLLNYARYRDWFEAEYLADVSKLTGQTFDDVVAANKLMMEVIAAGNPDQDEELTCMLHRRSLRLSMIIAGTNPTDENLLFYRLKPILD